ncbi:MAG: NAD(+) synthase [Bacilli bacterium]|nr:NAD(+) synthase [Bacilli bacterium]
MFDAKKETEKIIEFIRNYYKENHIKGAVIGISGGKDSGVLSALFAKAIGPENIVGITMPCDSKETDKIDAKRVADKYGFELIDIDLTDTFHTYEKQYEKFQQSEMVYTDSNINFKPRLRMATLYYVAAMYSKMKQGTYIVAGTSNKSESFVGYFTKGGDSVCDIKVISDLTVSEVIQVGEVLEVPKEVLYKAPSDGLSGQTDEDKLGVTYSDIEKYMNNEELPVEVRERIEYLHKSTRHKFHIPEYHKCD